MLREFARRFIGDRSISNFRDQDLASVVERSISYIHSEILLPVEYIDLYKNNECLKDILESDISLLDKIMFLNTISGIREFMYKWATYMINPKFKKNMYDNVDSKLTLIMENNKDIASEDYALSIKFYTGQEYLNDIIDEYCKSGQYRELLSILKDSCTTKKYNSILSVISKVREISSYRPTLSHSEYRMDFLITLVYMCNLDNEVIIFDGYTLTLKEWVGVILIDMSLLSKFMDNLISLY